MLGTSWPSMHEAIVRIELCRPGWYSPTIA
jgi:hypothetical protein